MSSGQVLDLVSAQAQYGNLATGKPGVQTAQTSVRASSDAILVKQSLRADVAEAVGIQQAVDASRQALDLRDRGDAEAAKKVLEDSAAALNALGSSLPAPSAAVREAAEKASEEAASIANEDEDYNRLRKAMKADQYAEQNQQSY